MRETWKQLDGRLFDFAAYYTFIAAQLSSPCTIAEVGVSNGTSAIFLAETLLNLGKKFTLHLVDNLAYGGANQLGDIVRNVWRAAIAELVEIHPTDSLQASCRFPDNHFDFVFIDASHLLEQTKADIRCWYPKIKDEGILAGHDYLTAEQVQMAVNAIVPATFTRPRTRAQHFGPESILQVEQTEQGYGVWWFRKQFYLKLN